MSANPHANGGLLLWNLRLPDFRDYAVKVKKSGGALGEATRIQGEFIRDVIKLNPAIFRVFSPDETNSNRWGAVFEVTDRCYSGGITPRRRSVAPESRVMEIFFAERPAVVARLAAGSQRLQSSSDKDFDVLFT